MKLRIQGNSVRLRLGPRELDRLIRQRSIEESTSFGPPPSQRLTYSLQAAEIPSAHVAFENGRLTVRLPIAQVDRWVSSDQVGIEATQPASDGAVLTILVEKDFECLDKTHATARDDVFGHPHSPRAGDSLKLPTP